MRRINIMSKFYNEGRSAYNLGYNKNLNKYSKKFKGNASNGYEIPFDEWNKGYDDAEKSSKDFEEWNLEHKINRAENSLNNLKCIS